MAAFNSLKRATASPLVSKLLSPIRSASVAPAVSRSFNTNAQMTNYDDSDDDRHLDSRSDSISRRCRFVAPSIFSDAFDLFSTPRSLSQVLNLVDQFAENEDRLWKIWRPISWSWVCLFLLSLKRQQQNAELFTLTYGAIVRQLLTDLEEVEEVNKQLDQMGYNIGIRLIDKFLAKSNVSRCNDFKETAEVIAKVGFKMFLGVSASVTNWDAEGTTCSIVLDDNPLVDFVELPDTYQGLHYCNILSGVLRGALEMVSMKTEIIWTRDMLRGDDAYELQVKLLKQIPEEYPYRDDE